MLESDIQQHSNLQLPAIVLVGTGIPRLIICLSQTVSGRESEFELVGEDLHVRIWSRLFS